MFGEVPVPRVALLVGARILQRFELEPFRRKANPGAVGQQTLTIGRNQVRHWAAEPDVPVEPQAAFHRVDHPIAAAFELREGR